MSERRLPMAKAPKRRYRRGPHHFAGEPFGTYREISERFGVSIERVRQWLAEGRTEPVTDRLRGARKGIPLHFDGRDWETRKECADALGVSVQTLRAWMKRGWDMPSRHYRRRRGDFAEGDGKG